MTKEAPKKIVLAYSGGLDTSVILPWLKERYPGVKLVAFAAELGQGDELSGIEAKAKKSGADEVVVMDLRQEFAEKYCLPMLRAHAVYEQDYLLGTSIARPLIAAKQVEVARQTGADAVGHGATGKGNDQVRFELTYMALAPDLKIIAPWKDPSFELRDRESAIDYAEKHNVPIPVSKTKIYSQDRNLWHISHEGAEIEHPDQEPNWDKCLTMTQPLHKTPSDSEVVEIAFEHGNPISVNQKNMPAHEIIAELNKIGGKHGVGVTVLVENRLVGMKSRGVYETPGGTILYEAHKALEQLCIERDTLHFKQQATLKYAELVYYGQWFHPLREALQTFMDHTNATVTGIAKVRLFKGRAMAVAASSPHSLYDSKLASFSMEGYDVTAARGFIDLFGLPMKVAEQAKRDDSHSEDIMNEEAWWNGTFKEREDTLENLFGRSHPSESPIGFVISLNLSWAKEWPDLVIPGACVQVFRPGEERAAGPPPVYDRLDSWFYLTLGLSQPIEGSGWRGVGFARAKPEGLSGYGAEFGIMLPTPEPWVNEFLRWLMAYVCTEAPVRGGHRLPFGFQKLGDGERSYFVGSPSDFNIEALDQTRSILFWPLLPDPQSVVTSTGEFEILIGTTITAAELAMAQQTSSGHLMLLLWLSGVKQQTLFGRATVTDDSRWESEWGRIKSLTYSDVVLELERITRSKELSA